MSFPPPSLQPPPPPVWVPMQPEVLVDTRRRVLAFLIDTALTLPGLAIYTWAFFSSFIEAFDEFETDRAPLPNFAWMAVGWLLAVGVQVVNRGIVQGRTGKSLGKRVMHLQVVRLADGTPAGIGWGLLRVFLEWVVGIVDVVLAFVTERRQRTGDMAAKTVVVNDEDLGRLLR